MVVTREIFMLRGKCLCGKVSFEISGDIPAMYQCHCSLCRKQSGAASSAATIVARDTFRWACGEGNISSWVKDTGFRSDFCSTCGAPVPNPLRDLPYVWVPVGLLEDAQDLVIRLQVFTESRAKWDTAFGPGTAHATAPPLPQFVELLHDKSRI